ncbi:MAG: helix-turn-helix domain-containing protein [Deltaproteobacteria bacterium]|nr:helix-turn-helix domain-containing protein [Deltaproteobacteria bacterium]
MSHDGHWLRQARQAAGLTQTGLARLVGVGQSTVSLLERGWLEPSAEQLSRLEHLLGARASGEPAPEPRRPGRGRPRRPRDPEADLARAIEAVRHARLGLRDAFPGQRFRCVLADPPWPFQDRGSRIAAEHPGCARPYTYMSADDIAGIEVGAVANARDALLWLWSTWSHLLDGSAQRVASAWGFVPKQVIPWIKVQPGASVARYQRHPAVAVLYDAGLRLQIGMGHYVRAASEPLLLCVRKAGRVPPERQLPGVICAPRQRHSQKPAEAYDFIETVCDGPRLELFARGAGRPGWAVWGAQAGDAA